MERHPSLRDAGVRARYARVDETLLMMCSRLSVEKRPGTALDALETLVRRGRRAVLVVVGDGPLRARLEQRARERRLPVTFLGHVTDRALVSALQASADVALAPGPAETFGLAALEAMACGTPVVASASSALPEVIGSAGAVAADHGEAFADAVDMLLERSESQRRDSARARAECFGWGTAVEAFLEAHDATVVGRLAAADPAVPARRAVTEGAA
jgi:alpha-1,6-mannosyltransferase